MGYLQIGGSKLSCSSSATHIKYQIIGIAEGLKYLHDEGVIHSDIKADNILISNDGAPRICDFGISRMLAVSQTLNSSTTGHTRGSVRWMAIELLNIDDQTPAHTIETDIWAFGMTVHVWLSCYYSCLHYLTI